MISLQAYLYTYSLLRGVTFKVLPLNIYALSPIILPLFEKLLAPPLWHSFQLFFFFFFFLHVNRNLCPFKVDFVMETKAIWSQISGIGWVFHLSNIFLGQKLFDKAPCELEHHGGKSNCLAKVKAFLNAQLHITASIFQSNKLG
jgi:hypothetical protein